LLGRFVREQSQRSFLGVYREQLQVGGQSGQLGGVGGQRLIPVDTQKEMAAVRQVQRKRDAVAIAEWRLRFPPVALAGGDIGLLVPDDGRAAAPAVLHHRIAPAFVKVVELGAVGRGRVVIVVNSDSALAWSCTTVAETVSNPSRFVNPTTLANNSSRLLACNTEVNSSFSMSPPWPES
jgi:hypothetical protein